MPCPFAERVIQRFWRPAETSVEPHAVHTVSCKVSSRCGFGRSELRGAVSELELGLDRHGPRELGHERLGEGLVDGHVVPLAPGHLVRVRVRVKVRVRVGVGVGVGIGVRVTCGA